jgi:predicted glycoside hydrolase/deacetylase ChbG (UPF0249 family)
MRRLIINADDFGWDDDTCDTTIALLESGAIGSATIMTGRPATARAIEYARQRGADFSFGLHFNIVDQHPALSPGVDSLTGPDGRFSASRIQRVRALTGRLGTGDIAAELDAQLGAIADAGVKLTHVDSHGHLHKFPAVIGAMRPVLGRFGIARVRVPQNLHQGRHMTRNLLNSYCRKAFRGLAGTENLYAISHHRPTWLDEMLAVLPPGTTELAIHPGRVEEWRAVEAAPFATGEAARRFAAAGVQLISFHDI